MSARIEIDIRDEAIAEKLAALAAAGRRLKPANAAVASALLFSSQQRFERQAGPDGAPWAPLKRQTVKDRERQGYGGERPILVRQGDLLRSLTAFASDDEAGVGTNLVYAALHQFGGEVAQTATRRTASFRLAREGAGRAKDGRRVGSKLRFASPRSKAKTLHERSFDLPARQFRIPARPFLGIDGADRVEILMIYEDHLLEAIGGRA